MQERREIECPEDEICFPCDAAEARGDSERERGIERPVRGGGERDGLPTCLEGVQFGGVCP